MIRLATTIGLLLGTPQVDTRVDNGAQDSAARDLPSTAAESKVAKPLIAVSNLLVLKTADPQAAGDTLVEKTRELGGYFSNRNDLSLTFKVPAKKADQLVAFVESMGTVIDRNYSAVDVGQALAEAKTRLRSRQDVYKRYFSVLRTAKAKAVVSVEREITSLIQEIEQLQGTLKLLEHQLALTEIEVHFRFPDRRPPLKTGNSSFAWLNTVNLSDLIQGFAREQ